MTITIDQLSAQASQHFSNVEPISESVLRITRTRGNNAFAIYYLDISGKLPDSTETLNKYQDNVIGSRYFENGRSVQWSNYLIFISSEDNLSSVEAKQAKELIENDRTYARKYVISEKEIDSVFTPQAFSRPVEEAQENVLSTWTRILDQANIEKAIFSDEDLPTRMLRIEKAQNSEKKTVYKSEVPPIKAAQFIRELELTKYRDHPRQSHFKFGTVNLIFGPNATGKTSLLEAIELFYCGRNKRNPDSKSSYKFTAVLADGVNETATSSRTKTVFRARHLEWYGQPELKTNNLYKSFAQFNFLDTDAAVSLSDSTKHIEEDLSKLLVGPDASKVWRNIERVNEAIRTRLRDLRPHKNLLKNDLEEIDNQLERIKNERTDSDTLLAHTKEMMARHNWKLINVENRDPIEALIGSLTELISVSKQAVSLDQISSPITYSRLINSIKQSKRIIDNAQSLIVKVNSMRITIMGLKKKREKIESARINLRQVVRYVEADWKELTEEQSKLKTDISYISGALSGFESAFYSDLPEFSAESSLSSLLARTNAEKLEIANKIEIDSEKYDALNKHAKEIEVLSQQLRQIAHKILASERNEHECPLCHTSFKDEELVERINSGAREVYEATAQEHLERIEENGLKIEELVRIEQYLSWLITFCERLGNSSSIVLGEAISLVKIHQTKLETDIKRLNDIDLEIEILAKNGLNSRRLENIEHELLDYGFPITDLSKAGTEKIHSEISDKLVSIAEKLNELENEKEAISTSLRVLFPTHIGESFEDAVSELKEHVETTKSISNQLKNLFSHYEWPDDRSLSEIISIAESVYNVAKEAKRVIDFERKSNTQRLNLESRRESLISKQEANSLVLERLNSAKLALDKIQSEHSLKNAMDSAIRINREAIESIFASIHAPDEFSGLGDSLDTLQRKNNTQSAKLSEISTGQRAAFALSVFLAQNGRLTTAPPVILIDDPVAHIDDLNSLSFLDYLREIAINGKRQIFFATANVKLANIFERKFDFLGKKDFRRFDLSREPE